MKYRLLSIATICLLFFAGCTKREKIVEEGNTPLDVHRVSTIKIKNYVNRTFIDILGRNPTIEEMDSVVTSLEENNLDEESRVSFISMLQSDTTFRQGDSTYEKVYYQRVYDNPGFTIIRGLR